MLQTIFLFIYNLYVLLLILLHIDYKYINNKIKFVNLLMEYKLHSVIVFSTYNCKHKTFEKYQIIQFQSQFSICMFN